MRHLPVPGGYARAAETVKSILLIGNISRQALMEGPQAVEQEFYAKVPPLSEEGGYIPAVDDAIISFESYKRYLDLARDFRLPG